MTEENSIVLNNFLLVIEPKKDKDFTLEHQLKIKK